MSQAEIDRIQTRLDELDWQLYNKPRDFFKGTRFTPEEARAHYDETMRLHNILYDQYGISRRHKTPKDFMSDEERAVEERKEFARKRWINRHYPGGVN